MSNPSKPNSSASPGPWHAHDFGTHRVVTDATGRILAELVDTPAEDVSKSNGPLISLAPEMAAMLRELEWSGGKAGGRPGFVIICCPCCLASYSLLAEQASEHIQGCALGALLDRLGRE